MSEPPSGPRCARIWAIAGALGLGACGADDEARDTDARATVEVAPDGLDRDDDAGRDVAADAGDPDATAPRPVVYFDLAAPLRVELSLAPSDWDALRFDAPGLLFLESETCPPGPRPDAFEWHPAELTLNGHAIGAVEVRKKGFLGSMDPRRPSLKVRRADGAPIEGLERLTLNNDDDDPSHLRQCLAYALFAEAGVAAPCCGVASVAVNGVELGVYAHVESIDADFVRSHFGADGGDLYEGQLADFREPQTAMFEPKTAATDPSLGPIHAVADALLEDGDVVAALEPVLDVDAFLTYWAMEVMLAFWDGYAGNTNNYYAYRPAAGRVQLVPWGTDEVMKAPVDYADGWLGHRGDMPWSVFAHGFIANRLYQDAAGRARYVTRLRERVAAWDEAAIAARIDRAEAAVAPLVLPDERAEWPAAVAAVRGFVVAQAARVTAELDAGPPTWDRGLRLFTCARPLRRATGTFTAPWDSLGDDPLTTGDGAVSEAVDGVTSDALVVRALSGPSDGGRDVRLQVGYGPVEGGRFAFMQVDVPRELVVAGAHIALDGGASYGQFALVDASSGDVQPVGFVLDGELVFDAVSTDAGGALSGSFVAPVGGIVWDTSDPLAPTR